MTAPTIQAQIAQPFVGNLIELFFIDLNPIGQNITFALTPSSSTPITYDGQVYTPAPISLTSISRSQDSAPGRPQLVISNLTKMLAAVVVQYSDIVGATVRYTRTFENYLDGQPNGGTGQQFPSLTFHIFQKDSFNQQAIQFTLATELDRPSLMLPRRQCLKNAQGRGALWAPGMQRTR